MLRVIFSIYVWLLVITITVVLTPIFVCVWLLTVFFDKRLIILHYFSNFWGSLFTLLVPGWNVKIEGKEKLDAKPKIIIANHQSQEDILLIYRLGVPFRWISKAEVFKIPFYGWLMYLKGDIKLQRSSKSSIKKMFVDAERVLRKGCIITIFPEGTRSKNGQLGNFKEGAFKLAKSVQIPITPVILYGTGQNLVYPNGLFKMKHTSTIKVLDEIPYAKIKDMDIVDLTKYARDIIEREIDIFKKNEH